MSCQITDILENRAHGTDIGTSYSHKVNLKIRFEPPDSSTEHLYHILHEKYREGEHMGVNHGFVPL